MPNPLTRAARHRSTIKEQSSIQQRSRKDILKSPCSCRRQTADHALASAATRKVFRGPRSGERSYNELVMSGCLASRVFPKHNPDEIKENGLQHEQANCKKHATSGSGRYTRCDGPGAGTRAKHMDRTGDEKMGTTNRGSMTWKRTVGPGWNRRARRRPPAR